MIDHVALRLLTAGAALDDLDPLERRVLDAHLPVCADCSSLAADLDGVIRELSLVAGAPHPPATLVHAVLSAIHATTDDAFGDV